MQWWSLIAGACMVGAFLVVAEAAEAADSAASICEAAANAYQDAVASGDPANVVATYAPGGEFITPFGIATGPEAIAKATHTRPGAKVVDTVTSARMLSDAALCSGEYALTAPGGVDLKGFWTRVIGKVGNDWKIQVLIYNITPPK